ncbi:MAG: hypothetical protein GY845_19440 [Planctomycetes bacterium]|nr:hypothetical protein [Planctomycetota bacterium]
MNEVSANAPGAGSNAHVIDATGNGSKNSKKAKSSEKIADDDAAAAIINNLVRTGAENNPINSNNNLTITSIIRENSLHLKQLAKQLEGRLRELGDEVESFKDNGLLERLKKEIEAFKGGGALERIKREMETLEDDNNDLEGLKKEIESIRDFQGFLLSVHEKIDEVTKYVQSHLEHIPDVEMDENLELGKLTIARMKEEALRALQDQANLDHERFLHFLKNETQAETALETE